MKYYNKFYDGAGNLVQRWTETWGKEEWLHRKEAQQSLYLLLMAGLFAKVFGLVGIFSVTTKKDSGPFGNI